MKTTRISSHFHILAAGILLFAATSCGTHRSTTTQVSTIPATSEKITSRNIVSQLAASYSDWQTLYIPFKMTLTSPMRLSVSGRATMVRGRSLHMSFRVLGMEVAVLYADNDSVHLVDKFHKYICSVPISSLTATSGVSLENIQSLLLGQAFYPGRENIATAPFAVAETNGIFILEPESQSRSFAWQYSANSAPEITALSIEGPDNARVAAAFSEFINSSAAGRIASDVDLQGSAKGKSFVAAIAWETGRAEWNSSRNTSWSAPSGYKNISVANLVNALKQM